MSDLFYLSDRALDTLVRDMQASALEVMDAHLSRIERWNPEVNAIVGMQAPDA